MRNITYFFVLLYALTCLACEGETDNCYAIECEVQPPTDELCLAYFENWFYNPETDNCELIGYSGCNIYGFDSYTECASCLCNPDLNPLWGEWNLISITCLCPTVELNIGESVWVFDTENDELIVQNTIAPQGNMLTPDTYPLTVNTANNTMDAIQMTICDYEFENDENTLIISCDVAVDGPRFTLVRSE